MARIAVITALAAGLTAWVVPPCHAQPGDLDLDRRCSTIKCVDEIWHAYCEWSSSAAEDCRRFVRALERSARAASRDFMLRRARALRSLEGLGADELLRVQGEVVLTKVEREAVLAKVKRNHRWFWQRQMEIYRTLIRNDPHDVEALLGLAEITEQRDEKLALFRRAAAADPRDPLILRLFARELVMDGTPEETAESVEHMLKAYEIAAIPHRWHVAQDVVKHMVRVGLHQEALEFQRRALSEMGMPNAEQVVRRAMAHDGARPSRELVSAVRLLCDRRSIQLGTTQSCVEAIEALSAASIAHAAGVSKATLDTIAYASLDALGDVDAAIFEQRHQLPHVHRDPRFWERLHAALARLSGTSLETPLLLYARAQAMSLIGPSSDVERPSVLLERAVTLAPYDGDARVWLGQAYMEEGRVADAIAQLEAGIHLSPDKVSSAHYDLVLALRKAGQTERADRLERQVLEEIGK